MDFGDILDEWERLSARPGGLKGAEDRERRLRAEEDAAGRVRRAEEQRLAAERAKARYSLESWLDEHGVEDKDRGLADAASEGNAREAEARRLRALRPQARLDLHGMTGGEAEAAVAAFLAEAAAHGWEKVLIVTGKGVHSKGEPVLGKAVRRALERSPLAGRFGEAGPADGGSGALWVLIRKRLISRGR